MPLYEYECQSCNERVEVIHKFSDPRSTICPQCGGELKKLVSAPAIQFKGSGFYVNDYKRTGSDGEKPSATPTTPPTAPSTPTGSSDSVSNSSTSSDKSSIPKSDK